MKWLTATLLAEQKKPRAKPYVQVRFYDRLGPDLRLTWSQVYSVAGSEMPHAMVIAADDSIVRVRNNAGNVERQRITDPTNESQWNSWTDTTWDCKAGFQVSLATTGAYVWMFYISPDGRIVKCHESSNYGATFGAFVNVHTCATINGTESVAGAVQNNGEPIVFFSCGDPAGLQTHLYVCKRTSGVWGSASSWGKSAIHRVKGLAVYKSTSTDYNLLFGGQDAGVIWYVWNFWSICYGDGVDQAAGTWANPVKLEVTDEGTQYGYSWPSLMRLDVYRALLVCSYSGTNSYDRVHRMRVASGSTYMTSNWTDPAPFQADDRPYGMCLAYRYGGDGYLYAACSHKAWRAPVAGLPSVTFTDRVKKYRLVDRWMGHKAGGMAIDMGDLIAPEMYGELWLDNSDGELNSLGSGDYEVMKRGSQVLVGRGYETSEGGEYSNWPYLWLEDYEHVADFRGRSYVVLYLVGPWLLLSSMTARRQYYWEPGSESVFEISEHLMALAGLDLVGGGEQSSEVGTLKPWFVVYPGEDLRGAVLRALSKAPDFVFFSAATGYLKELADDEGSDYSYGGDGEHVIISGRYGVRSPGYNHIEVFAGIDLFGDDLDIGEISLLGHRLQKIFDYGYTTDAQCAARATGQVRKHLATSRRGELVTLPNVGLQLFDVVTVTDGRCGISSEIYRVRGIEEVFDTTKPPMVFRQTVALGAR